jgi:hypothetical protein
MSNDRSSAWRLERTRPWGRRSAPNRGPSRVDGPCGTSSAAHDGGGTMRAKKSSAAPRPPNVRTSITRLRTASRPASRAGKTNRSAAARRTKRASRTVPRRKWFSATTRSDATTPRRIRVIGHSRGNGNERLDRCACLAVSGVGWAAGGSLTEPRSVSTSGPALQCIRCPAGSAGCPGAARSRGRSSPTCAISRKLG